MRNAYRHLFVRYKPHMDWHVTDPGLHAQDQRDFINIGVDDLTLVDGDVPALVCLDELRKKTDGCLVLAFPFGSSGAGK